MVAGVVLFLIATVRAEDASSAIEQSRLYQQTQPLTGNDTTSNANGISLGPSTPSDDESFGAQQIVKAQQTPPQFYIGMDVSTYYTSNVALTHRDAISDGFVVTDAGAGWTPQLTRDMQMQLGIRASIFRYFDTSSLDFESISPGIGVLWTPQWSGGVALAADYSFTELLDRHSTELLEDHEFTLALQKVIPFGRSHGLTVAILGSAGISNPYAEQRDQAGFALAYHVRLARKFDADLGYRLSGYFYNQGGRNDLNQIGTLGLHYYFTPWASLDGFVSGATNSSNRTAFKYNVFSSGGGVSVSFRF